MLIRKLFIRNNFLTKVIRQGKMYTKPSQEELKQKLTPIQYRVTQESGTEPPYSSNAFHEF